MSASKFIYAMVFLLHSLLHFNFQIQILFSGVHATPFVTVTMSVHLSIRPSVITSIFFGHLEV